jgi:hypothetical protein
MKTCSTCKISQPLDCFYKDKNKKDGYGYRCKKCDSLRVRKRTDHTKHQTYWKLKNQLAYKAHRAVRTAVNNGLIVKTLCVICGGKSEAHHPDYSRPLDVVWLCRPHHLETHKLTK